MEARDYEADYRQLIMQHEDLKDKYAHLNTKYEEEKKLNDELIEINRKTAKASKDTADIYLKYHAENERMKSILKQGIFIEYDNDSSTMEYVPILGNLDKFKFMNKRPSKMMYTFKFQDIQAWLEELYKLMKGENIIKIDPEKLK